MQYLSTISKMTEWFWFVSKAKPLNITVIQVYAPTTNAKEAEIEWSYKALQDLLELTQKRYFYIIWDWNAKVESQEIPGVTNRQIWTWSTKWSRKKVKVTQSCLTPCNPMDYAVLGILQARIQEWVTLLFSRGSSQPRDWMQVSCIAGGFFTNWGTRKVPKWSRAKANRALQRGHTGHSKHPLPTTQEMILHMDITLSRSI